MNRKLIAILTALLLTASLCACGDDTTTETTGGESQIVVPGSESETLSDETGSESESESKSEEESTAPIELNFITQKDTVYVIARNGSVNLRTDTSLSDASIKVAVSNGTMLQRIAVSENGEWSKVIFDDYAETELYVKSLYITTLSDIDADFTVCETPFTRTLKANLNVRITPSMENDILHVLVPENVVTVVAENTVIGWYKVQIGSGENMIEGYIASDEKYFEPIEEAPAE